jgi:hypothetical protein
MYLLFLTLALGIKVVCPEKLVFTDDTLQTSYWQEVKRTTGLLNVTADAVPSTEFTLSEAERVRGRL